MRNIFDITNPPIKPKRTPSAKQLKALAKSRGLRTQAMFNRMYNEALSKFRTEIPLKNGQVWQSEMLPRRKFINRLRAISQRKGITIHQAYDIEIHSMAYMTPEDNYKYQIKRYVNGSPSEFAQLRKMISEAQGTTYTHTSVNWDLFVYDPGTKNLEMTVTNPTTGVPTVICVRIVEGANSDTPNFVEISKR